jgi:hypothetical protein
LRYLGVAESAEASPPDIFLGISIAVWIDIKIARKKRKEKNRRKAEGQVLRLRTIAWPLARASPRF